MKFRRDDEDYAGLVKRLNRAMEAQEQDIAKLRSELRELRKENTKLLARNEQLESLPKTI